VATPQEAVHPAPGPPRGVSAVAASLRSRRSALLRLLIALAATVAIFSALIAALGVSPLDAFSAFWDGSVGSTFSLGQTVMIASLLACTGLAAAIPFQAHLWNVGGEGQLWAGAVAAVALGLKLPDGLADWQAITITVIGACLAGALWGFIPGILKATVNANEVITSLMLVFIAIALGNYAISTLFPSQSNQTESVPFERLLPNIWTGTLVTAGALLALGAVLIAIVLMTGTSLGFQIRAVGLNRNTARISGMRTGRVIVLAMVIGGAFGGLAGAIAVLGINGAVVAGFSANFGFLGIAVALVARLKPLWIVPSALLFAALRTGSSGLQAQTGISATVGEILVTVLVIMLLALGVIRLRYAEAAQ
jgi:general nucleoside transport system permease protein